MKLHPLAVQTDDEDLPRKNNHRALFGGRATTVFRAALLGGALLVAGIACAGFEYYHSPYWSAVGYAVDQPVLFSHRHHAGELQIDCRYCHATVEKAAFAGMPSTHTCMTCHSQIFTQTAMLQPVVLSAERGAPLHWNRVNNLPDHVFFNHSIHLAKGVACTTCHGDVGGMALTAKGQPLSMRWCLDCHRNPAPRLSDRADLFLPVAPLKRNERSAADNLLLLRERQIDTQHLTNCSTCHH